MADEQRLSEVKKVLDSPSVSDDVKRRLIAACGSGSLFGPAELQAYADRLGIPSSMVMPGGPFMPRSDVDRIITQAHRGMSRHDANQGKHALADGATGAANANLILDFGAPGLRYFEYFAPLYQRCAAGSEISRNKACELYDEQRDMDFSVLRRDGEILTKAAAKLSDEIANQRNSWNTINQIWTGQGAAAAGAFVGGHLADADTSRSQMTRFAALLGPAADALEQAIHDKAQFVANLYAETIGGKTPEQIDEIIKYASTRTPGPSSIPEAVRILQIFGASASPGWSDVGKALLSPAGAVASFPVGLIAQAQQFASTFVANVFKPDVESKWRGLTECCWATDRSVNQIYQRIIDNVNTMNEDPFSSTIGALPPLAEAPRGSSTELPESSGRHSAPMPAGSAPMSGGDDPSVIQPQHAPPAAPARPGQPSMGSLAPAGASGSGLTPPTDSSGYTMPPRPSDVVGPPTATSPGAAEVRDPSADTAMATPTPAISISDGRSTLPVVADEGGAQALNITGADPTGHEYRYAVDLGPDGLPQQTAQPPTDSPEVIAAPDAIASPSALAGPSTDLGGVSAAPTGVSLDQPPTTDTAGLPEGMTAEPAADETSESVQIRAASATGWNAATEAAPNQGQAPGPVPADSGADSIAGGAVAMGGLQSDLTATSVTGKGVDDQWLLGGSHGSEDGEWASLGSVLAPKAANPAADGRVATLSGNVEGLTR